MLVITNLYSENDVGIAYSVIGALGWFSLLSLIGMDETVRRYIPEVENKTKFLNTCIQIAILISLVIAPVVLLFLTFLDSNLVPLTTNLVSLSVIVALILVITIQALQDVSITFLYH